MSGSKVFVKKPIRRYERSFEEKPVTGEFETNDEIETPVNPDITSPAGIKGPVMNSKKQPVRLKVKPVSAKSKRDEKTDKKAND